MSEPASAAYCRRCDYPLAGVAAAACPECGLAFDLADPETFSRRPGVRRRRWIRRGLWAAGAIVFLEVFAPARVARMRWSWPNADGITATTTTRWYLAAPRWLPIRYPHWSAGDQIIPMPTSGGLIVHAGTYWRIGYVSIREDGGNALNMTPAPGGPRIESWVETSDGVELAIRSANIHRLCEMMLDFDPTRPIIFSTRAVATPPSPVQDTHPPDPPQESGPP